MKSYRIYILSVVLGCSLLSCEKQEVPLFDGEDAIYIATGQTQFSGRVLVNQDSINAVTSYSVNFGFMQDEVMTDTIRIPLRVLGRVSNQDRPVDIAIIREATDAVEGRDFQIFPAMIPANSIQGQLVVVLNRTESLGEDARTLRLQVMTNEHFPRYMYIDSVNVYNQAEISLLNVFRRPDNWEGVWYFGQYYQGFGLGLHFGDYSDTKYRLILELAGTNTIIPFYLRGFPETQPGAPGYFTDNEWRLLIYRIQLYLIRYMQENGRPMLDENGEEITIPGLQP